MSSKAIIRYVLPRFGGAIWAVPSGHLEVFYPVCDKSAASRVMSPKCNWDLFIIHGRSAAELLKPPLNVKFVKFLRFIIHCTSLAERLAVYFDSEAV